MSGHSMTALVCWVVCVTGALPAVISAGDEPKPPTASIRVDTRRPIGEVNPWILGGNLLGYQVNAWTNTAPEYRDYGSGVWDPEARAPVAPMIALARSAGLSVARWPGGCGSHLFDWKKTIGPIAERPLQQFGLPEFLRVCEAMGSVPLITLADYQGTSRDAADLVEYLNAPDDGSYPWARRRAEDGRPEPWNVLWFEYGNESEHGDHRGHKMTPQQYARNYRTYRRAMKAVDDRVQLGAVIATGFPDLDGWARTVLSIIGADVDFVIHHSYKPGYYRNDGEPDAKSLFRIALAGADQTQAYYDKMRELLNETTGCGDIPIAVTEYNGHFVQEQPVPYRHTLGNALVNAEMIRVFMNAANRIIMANFWQFSNEYWGAVKGYVHKGDALVKRPQYYVFELYHNHFGEQLLPVKVESSAYDTDGGYGVQPARGTGSRHRLFPGDLLAGARWDVVETPGVEQSVADGVLMVEFLGDDVNYYHARKYVRAEPEMGYLLAGWIRTEDLGPGDGVSLELIDARGWDATRHAGGSKKVSGTTDWTRVEARLIALPDTERLEVRARRTGGSSTVTGRAWFRDLELRRYTPRSFPAVAHLAVNASRSRDGKTVYLMVVNKNLDDEIATTISLAGFPGGRARAWTLSGPGPDATNETDPSAVAVTVRGVGQVGREFSFRFPPCSMTALEVAPSG